MNTNQSPGSGRRGAGAAWLESVVVILVVVVLAGIAAAGAISAARVSRLSRLDGEAERLFQEVSRNLTVVCARERTQLMRDEAYEVALPADFLSGLGVAGVDGTGEEAGYGVYYIRDSMDTPASAALLEGVASLGLESDRFCVFYAVGDNGSASVLEVWCTSRALADELPQDLAFDALSDPNRGDVRARLRDDDARSIDAGGLVGRCGVKLASGDMTPWAIDDGAESFRCWLEVKNAEELTAALYCYIPQGNHGSFYREEETELSYTLVIKGVSSGAEKAYASGDVAYAADAGRVPEGADGRVYELGTYTLDSLKGNGSFLGGYGPDGFVPGEDILLELSVACAVNGAAALPVQAGEDGANAAAVRVNSLFASATLQSSHCEVEIAYGRHLQNLDSALSGVDYGVLPIRAAQVQDIYFNGVYDTGVYPGDRRLFSDGRGALYDEPVEQWTRTYETRTFLPVDNPMLASYDGGGYMIDDLTAVFSGLTGAANAAMGVHSAAEAGLFGTFFGGELKNIRLIDPILGGDGELYAPTQYAGGLAGRTTGAVTIESCGVSMRARLGAVTGREGRVYADAVDWLTAEESAGGLVGWSSGPLTIMESYAATVVEGGYAGGLVGYAGGALRVSGCYADCYLAGRRVGGLAGQYGGAAEFASSFSAGMVLGTVTYAGQFVGRDTVPAADDACYSVFCFTDLMSGERAEHVFDNGLTAPERTDLAAAGGAYYLADAFDAEAPDESVSLLRWPYPTLGLPHYGDWYQVAESVTGDAREETAETDETGEQARTETMGQMRQTGLAEQTDQDDVRIDLAE